jgi:GTP-binding protein
MADPSALKALGPDEIEEGRLLFAQACEFITAAVDVDVLPPPDLPEVAFAGRSNVGKSSLLNALVGRRALARTSSTPGRTREIIFFDLGGRLRLVDLPGYGYARASKQAVAAWTRLIEDYLRGRPNLRRVLLLVDCRMGLKESDETALSLLDQAAVPVKIVVTKVDKAGDSERAEAHATVEAALRAHPAALPHIAETSALKGQGIAELRAAVAALAR